MNTSVIGAVTWHIVLFLFSCLGHAPSAQVFAIIQVCGVVSVRLSGLDL
jgi:hypothetical protein